MLAAFPFATIMSLGVDCRVRFQISRFFEARKAAPPNGGSDQNKQPLAQVLKGTNLFDWNICWFSSVIAVLEDRFSDLFVKENLRPMAGDLNVAIDKRYDIRFFHLFHRGSLESFEDMVATQYDEKSKKVEYLKMKFLDHLNSANPTIYIRCQGSEIEAQKFCHTVRANYPKHQFHLVLVDVQEETEGFVVQHDNYSVYRMTGKVNKPQAAAWTGDDDEWNTLFHQIRSESALVGIR